MKRFLAFQIEWIIKHIKAPRVREDLLQLLAVIVAQMTYDNMVKGDSSLSTEPRPGLGREMAREKEMLGAFCILKTKRVD